MKRSSALAWLAVLAVIIALLLSYTACDMTKDVPRHSAEEVVSIAKAFSPNCKLQVGEQRHG